MLYLGQGACPRADRIRRKNPQHPVRFKPTTSDRETWTRPLSNILKYFFRLFLAKNETIFFFSKRKNWLIKIERPGKIYRVEKKAEVEIFFLSKILRSRKKISLKKTFQGWKMMEVR